MMDDGDGEISLEDFLHGARWGGFFSAVGQRKAPNPKAPPCTYVVYIYIYIYYIYIYAHTLWPLLKAFLYRYCKA